MTPARAGLRSATAAGLAALAVAVFGFPQPFLAVLASQLVVSQARGGGRFLGCNLWAVGIGAFSGVGALTLCAQEPWLLLPVGGIVAGIGGACWWGSRGPVAAMVFLMGLVAPMGSGLIYPEGAVINGFAHAGSLILALLAAAVARALFGRDADEQIANEEIAAYPLAVSKTAFGLLSGLSVLAGFGTSALLLPGFVVPLSISVVAACCSFGSMPVPGVIRQKIWGAILGGVIATVFVILVAGAGNDLAVLVGGLVVVLGTLEAMARRSVSAAGCYRQAAAIFAVAATMLPAPLAHLSGVLLRVVSVWVGFALALLVGLALLHFGRKHPDLNPDHRAG